LLGLGFGLGSIPEPEAEGPPARPPDRSRPDSVSSWTVDSPAGLNREVNEGIGIASFFPRPFDADDAVISVPYIVRFAGDGGGGESSIILLPLLASTSSKPKGSGARGPASTGKAGDGGSALAIVSVDEEGTPNPRLSPNVKDGKRKTEDEGLGEGICNPAKDISVALGLVTFRPILFPESLRAGVEVLKGVPSVSVRRL